MNTPDLPARIGPYAIQDLLGEGGSAWVYRAYDPRLERRVALKVLKLPSPEWVARLRHEAHLQARLHHPHLAQVFEVDEDGGRVYLAMQLIPGDTLARLAPELDLTAKARVVAQAADAVHAAHRAGLIHRDIKPANILVGRDDVGNPYPYVVDFGLARIWEGQSLTAPGQVLGSPAYMAPEQAQGRPVDPRTDVYGLGATLFDVLAGRPPFEGRDIVSLLMRVVDQEAPRLGSLLPGLPPELEAIVERCLQKDPGRRYPSAAHLRADLERFLDGEPILARPEGPLGRARKWVARNRLLAGVAGVSLAAILALGGLLAWSRVTENRRLALAQRLGQTVTALESDLQRAYLLPAHDVAPVRAEARRRIAAMVAEGARLGPRSSGTAALAVGRALLLMEEMEEAFPHLERALALGEQNPEASRAFGLACAALYRRELMGTDPTDKAALAALEAKYRNPARIHLAKGREASPDLPVPYLEAQLAACDGRWEEARARALECRTLYPFFYQAFFFEGELLLDRAAEALQKGRVPEGMARVDEAERLFQDCVRIARSYPRAYAGLAACQFRRLDRIFMTAQGDPAADLAAGKAAFDAALGVDSESVVAHATKSLFLMRAANLTDQRGGEARPLYDESSASARKALALKPTDPFALRAAFYADTALGQWAFISGMDPAEPLGRAIPVGEALVKAKPGFLMVLKDLGLAASMLACRRAQAGEDAEAQFQRAAELAATAAEKKPGAVFLSTSGAIRLRWARARFEAGRDPEPVLGEAIAALQKGLALNPTYPNLLEALGEARTLQGSATLRAGGDPSAAWTEAEARFQAILAQVKEHPEARIGLGRLWLARAAASGAPEAWRQARAWADLATRAHPANPAGWLLLARVERARAEAAPASAGGWSAALKAVDRALALGPGHPEASFERLAILKGQSGTSGPQQEAFARELDAFLTAFPRHAGAQALRAAAPPGP